MAKRYCDHGGYPAYTATPTWGVPQEGDGTTKDLATASAIASIDLSGATFVSGTSTISIMGCTALTVGAGANSALNVQYNATLATMIDNIVAVINTLMTANAVNIPSGWTVHLVRNSVFARRSGNTLELMTRSGSASWNGLTAIAFAGVTGATSAAWVGGSGGCWGYFWNGSETGALWPSGLAAYTYSVNAPLAGRLTVDDVVMVRAKDNKVIITATAACYLYMAGSVCVDADNSVWPDTNDKYFAVEVPSTHSHASLNVYISTSVERVVFSATKKSKLQFRNASPFAGSACQFHIFTTGPGGPRHLFYKNVWFDDASGAITTFAGLGIGHSYTTAGVASHNFVAGCTYSCARNTTAPIQEYAGNLTYRHVIAINDMDFVFPAASGVKEGLFYSHDNCSVRATNVRMSSPALFSLVRKGTANTSCVSSVDNARGFDLRLANNLGLVNLYGRGGAGMDRCFTVQSNCGPDSAFRIESNTHLIDWLPGNQYPALDAITPNGTPWSWRWNWSGDTVAWVARPITSVIKLTKRALSETNVRTVRLDLLVPSNIASSLDTSLISLRVTYESPTGLVSVDTTCLFGFSDEPVAVPDSAAVWDKGAYPSYVAKYLEITTPSAVIANSEIGVELICSYACPAGAADVFINPNPGVA